MVVVISTSPHVGEDAERVGVVTRRSGGARGWDGVHVALVPLQAALPGEGAGADVTEVDVPHRGVQHLVALHVGLVAEGLGAHVAAERARLLPRAPVELRHCGGQRRREKRERHQPKEAGEKPWLGKLGNRASWYWLPLAG